MCIGNLVNVLPQTHKLLFNNRYMINYVNTVDNLEEMDKFLKHTTYQN